LARDARVDLAWTAHRETQARCLSSLQFSDHDADVAAFFKLSI
jgi:hypothetical protein